MRLELHACRRMFQGAVSGSACDHTTAAEIDKAFPPGFSIPDSFQRLVVALLQAVWQQISRTLIHLGPAFVWFAHTAVHWLH